VKLYKKPDERLQMKILKVNQEVENGGNSEMNMDGSCRE
jgi:hypothetical protein